MPLIPGDIIETILVHADVQVAILSSHERVKLRKLRHQGHPFFTRVMTKPASTYVKWLIRYHVPQLSRWGIYIAIMWGDMDLMEYYWREAPWDLELQKWVLSQTACTGRVHVMEWLSERFPDAFTDRVMDVAAGYGHLELVQWLSLYRDEGASYWALNLAARHGHMKLVKWLLESPYERSVEQATRFALEAGRHEIASFIQGFAAASSEA